MVQFDTIENLTKKWKVSCLESILRPNERRGNGHLGWSSRKKSTEESVALKIVAKT